MDTQITQQISQKVLSEAQREVAKQPQTQDVETFKQAMQEGGGQQQQTQQTSTVEGTQRVQEKGEIQPTEGVKNSGEKILDNLSNMNKSFKESLQKIHNILDKDGMQVISTRDMMKVQMELYTMQFKQEMTSKIATKSTQNLDSLLKNQ